MTFIWRIFFLDHNWRNSINIFDNEWKIRAQIKCVLPISIHFCTSHRRLNFVGSVDVFTRTGQFLYYIFLKSSTYDNFLKIVFLAHEFWSLCDFIQIPPFLLILHFYFLCWVVVNYLIWKLECMRFGGIQLMMKNKITYLNNL